MSSCRHPFIAGGGGRWFSNLRGWRDDYDAMMDIFECREALNSWRVNEITVPPRESHLLTYPPLHCVVCRLGSWHASVLGPLPSLSSSVFWPYRLSPGLAISALAFRDSASRLPSSARSFSWHHLYLAFEHVRTISTSSLWGSPPSGACVPLSRCLRFWHGLESGTPESGKWKLGRLIQKHREIILCYRWRVNSRGYRPSSAWSTSLPNTYICLKILT